MSRYTEKFEEQAAALLKSIAAWTQMSRSQG